MIPYSFGVNELNEFNQNTMKFFLKTFGCQMNKADSEKIAAVLEKHHLQETNDPLKAELIILNTCAVRQAAEDRFFNFLKKCHNQKIKKPLILGITGCLLASKRKEIERFADFCFKIDEIENLLQLFRKQKIQGKKLSEITPTGYLEAEQKKSSTVHAYVPIMNGCDNFCSYCSVPIARGREKSREPTKIITEIEVLIKKGFRAFTLLGQNVNSYGKNLRPKIDFAELLEKICAISGDFWLWFFSSHPKDLSPRLIKTMAREKKICPHLHFAVQSGSNKILEKMNRHYTRERCLALAEKIKKAVPNISLSTDIIVGFPGETETDFKQTLDLCEKIGFEMVFCGKYSPRPLTKAAGLPETVSMLEKKKREQKLLKLIEKINLKKNQKLLGAKVKVLSDKQVVSKNASASQKEYCGKTASFKTVVFKSSKLIKNGDFVEVTIKEVLNWGLKGEAA